MYNPLGWQGFHISQKRRKSVLKLSRITIRNKPLSLPASTSPTALHKSGQQRITGFWKQQKTPLMKTIVVYRHRWVRCNRLLLHTWDALSQLPYLLYTPQIGTELKLRNSSHPCLWYSDEDSSLSWEGAGLRNKMHAWEWALCRTSRAFPFRMILVRHRTELWTSRERLVQPLIRVSSSDTRMNVIHWIREWPSPSSPFWQSPLRVLFKILVSRQTLHAKLIQVTETLLSQTLIHSSTPFTERQVLYSMKATAQTSTKETCINTWTSDDHWCAPSVQDKSRNFPSDTGQVQNSLIRPSPSSSYYWIGACITTSLTVDS